jgi:hypothetical protein
MKEVKMKKLMLAIVLLISVSVAYADDDDYGRHGGWGHEHRGYNGGYYQGYQGNQIYYSQVPVYSAPTCNPYYNNCGYYTPNYYQPNYYQPQIGISVPGFGLFFNY